MLGDSVSTEEIFAVLERERRTGELLPLGRDFYSKNQIETEESETGTAGKQKENHDRLIESLKAKRLQKILTYIAYGRNLPAQIPEEEERLYIRINNIIKEEKAGNKKTKIKITSDMPELITPGGKKIGPFVKDSIISPESEKETEFLIENKLGEKVIV